MSECPECPKYAGKCPACHSPRPPLGNVVPLRLVEREPQEDEPPADPEKPKVDLDTIETLETALDMAKAGDVTGCIVIMGLNLSEADRELVTDTTQLIGFNVPENITLFLGALEQAKWDIVQLRNELYDSED